MQWIRRCSVYTGATYDWLGNGFPILQCFSRFQIFLFYIRMNLRLLEVLNEKNSAGVWDSQ